MLGTFSSSGASLKARWGWGEEAPGVPVRWRNLQPFVKVTEGREATGPLARKVTSEKN